MKYAIVKNRFEEFIETVGIYDEQREAENNAELLNKVDPFNDYYVQPY